MAAMVGTLSTSARWAGAFRFELRKAAHTRATWVTLLLPPLLAVISVCFSHAQQQAQLGERAAQGIASAFLPFARGASSGLVLAGILVLFYASGLLANEGTLRTYKTILVRAHTRSEWVWSKLALASGLALGSLAAVALASLAAGAVIGDYTDISEEGYVIYAAELMRTQSLWAVLLAIPPLLALTAFGLMVSAFTDHAGIAAGASIGTYFVLEVLKSSLADSRVLLFNTFLPSLLDTSYLESLRGLANGMSDTGWEVSRIWFNLLTPGTWALLFTAIAWHRFARRDFAL